MSHFFKFPINYGYDHSAFSVDSQDNRTPSSNINDNDYTTFSTENRFIIETHGDLRTDSSKITHIFIKGKGIDSYSVSIPTGMGTGTGFNGRVIPVDQTANDFQHDLQPLTSVDATEIQVDVVGASSQVYVILLLESVMDVPTHYEEINIEKEDSFADIRTNIKGNTFSVRTIGDRYKWQASYSQRFYPEDTPDWQTFVSNLESLPNLTFAENFSENPDRVFPAVQTAAIGIDYIGLLYTQALISFAIREV